jgi:hypothetical protein
MNLFQEAKSVLDKDGKVNALGPYGKQKLTGREVSTYFMRNKVKSGDIKKAVEVALDLGGADTIARKEIRKFFGDAILKAKEVQNALRYANEETFREDLNRLSEEPKFNAVADVRKQRQQSMQDKLAIMRKNRERADETASQARAQGRDDAADAAEDKGDRINRNIQDLKKKIRDMDEDTNEACWDDYKQVGTKKKGGKTVPNCVPKEEVDEGKFLDRFKKKKKKLGTKNIFGEPTDFKPADISTAKHIANYRGPGVGDERYRDVVAVINRIEKGLSAHPEVHKILMKSKKKFGESVNEDTIVENFRKLAQKGMGAETRNSIKVGTVVDFYDNSGSKRDGKIIKIGPIGDGYTVKDTKDNKVYKFKFHDRMKAKKLLQDKDKLSNIIKKNTIKKGKFAGYMTDSVEEAQQGARQSVMDTYRNIWEEVLQEEMITYRVKKMQRPEEQKFNQSAKMMGLKITMNKGKDDTVIVMSGTKKKLRDFDAIARGKSSYGDPSTIKHFDESKVK